MIYCLLCGSDWAYIFPSWLIFTDGMSVTFYPENVCPDFTNQNHFFFQHSTFRISISAVSSSTLRRLSWETLTGADSRIVILILTSRDESGPVSLSSNDRTESGQVTWDRPIRGQAWWGLKQYWHCNLHCLSYNELRAKTSFVSDYGCKHTQSALAHRPRLQAFRFVGVFIIVIGTVGVFRIRAKYRILLPDLLTDAFNKANDKINCFINRRV